jgi:hypothetical protein
MALDPRGKSAELTAPDLAVLNRLERDLDEAIRANAPGTRLIYVWRDGVELSIAQIRHLERRYIAAGWSKLVIAPTAGGAQVVTILP